MRPKLIGIDASRAVMAQRTGTEVYSLHLVRSLLEIKTDHHFCMYFNTPPRPGLIPDVAHCRQRVIPFPRLWTHVRLSAEMLLDPADVLFVPSHVLPLIHPRQSIVTVHDLGHHHYPAAHTAGQRLYLEVSTRYHVRVAAQIIADSQTTKDDLVRIYGANPDRVTVAHLGVDPALRPVQDPAHIARVRHKYGIAERYILYVGTLQPRKNLSRLIQAFARLQTENERVQLVLAGKKGWLVDAILEQADALDLRGRVLFPGFVDDADLAALYSGAALFAMPSLYEGFCMPVLEAMACGTPVICSNTSCLPEIVGQAALLFDPLDVDAISAAMNRILNDRDLANVLVERGMDQNKLFTWPRCALQVFGVLERAILNA